MVAVYTVYFIGQGATDLLHSPTHESKEVPQAGDGTPGHGGAQVLHLDRKRREKGRGRSPTTHGQYCAVSVVCHPQEATY